MSKSPKIHQNHQIFIKSPPKFPLPPQVMATHVLAEFMKEFADTLKSVMMKEAKMFLEMDYAVNKGLLRAKIQVFWGEMIKFYEFYRKIEKLVFFFEIICFANFLNFLKISKSFKNPYKFRLFCQISPPKKVKT